MYQLRRRFRCVKSVTATQEKVGAAPLVGGEPTSLHRHNQSDIIPQAWTAWTPVLVWTGGVPTGVYIKCHWTRLGCVVFINVYITVENSKAVTGLTISLPVICTASSCVNLPLGVEFYGTARATIGLNYPYIWPGENRILFWVFRAGTNAQPIDVLISGQYEVS